MQVRNPPCVLPYEFLLWCGVMQLPAVLHPHCTYACFAHSSGVRMQIVVGGEE